MKSSNPSIEVIRFRKSNLPTLWVSRLQNFDKIIHFFKEGYEIFNVGLVWDYIVIFTHQDLKVYSKKYITTWCEPYLTKQNVISGESKDNTIFGYCNIHKSPEKIECRSDLGQFYVKYKDRTVVNCPHDFIEYCGIVERFQHCKYCNLRKDL